MIAKDLSSGVEKLGEMIAEASIIVPFTGAGISTDDLGKTACAPNAAVDTSAAPKTETIHRFIALSRSLSPPWRTPSAGQPIRGRRPATIRRARARHARPLAPRQARVRDGNG